MGELMMHTRKLTRGLKRAEELGKNRSTIMAAGAHDFSWRGHPAPWDQQRMVGRGSGGIEDGVNASNRIMPYRNVDGEEKGSHGRKRGNFKILRFLRCIIEIG